MSEMFVVRRAGVNLQCSTPADALELLRRDGARLVVGSRGVIARLALRQCEAVLDALEASDPEPLEGDAPAHSA